MTKGDNVVSFPKSGAKSADKLREQEMQLDLFLGASPSINAVTFLNITKVSQDDLLKIIIKNSVDMVIDLRLFPVFPKNQFDHKFIMNYFYARRIRYLEISEILKKSPNYDNWERKSGPSFQVMEQEIIKYSGSGMIACLTDTSSIEDGLASAFRHFMNASLSGWVEVNSRSVI